jgi:alkylation response protein AidB-like acyl-CoA dehydrogenase
MDQAAWQADTAVRQAASGAAGTEPHRVAREVTAARTSAVEACERVVDEAGRVVGPGGLSTNPRLARTLADLLIYVRQHHLDATWEVQGRAVLETGTVAG